MDFGYCELIDVQDVAPIEGEALGTAFVCTVEFRSYGLAERVPYAARQSDAEPTGQWVYAQCLAQWQG